VGAEIPERHDLTGGWHHVQSRVLAAQMKARHAQAAAVFENQVLERPASVPDDKRRALLGDRDDSTARFRRPATVEDTEFDARHVLLDDGVDDGAMQTIEQLAGRPCDDDAGPALPLVRFEYDRE